MNTKSLPIIDETSWELSPENQLFIRNDIYNGSDIHTRYILKLIYEPTEEEIASIQLS